MKIESIVTIKKELKHFISRRAFRIMPTPREIQKRKIRHYSLIYYLNHMTKMDTLYSVKTSLDELFEGINSDSYFYMKKTIRKILRQIRVYSRYSLKKTTEVELLLYFCERMNELKPTIHRNTTLSNLYERQILSINKKISVLHEDLQYDYNLQLEDLKK